MVTNAAASLLFGIQSAPLTLPNIIGSNMVLQADGQTPIWGTAAPGARVQVRFQSRHHYAETGDDGKWSVNLTGLNPGSSDRMTISSGNSQKVLENVAVGDVWLGSGQSNMYWPLQRTEDPDRNASEANYPDIRLFAVTLKADAFHKGDVEGKWVVCTPKTAISFSAVLYYFGREMHRTTGRPTGLIHSSWGGTRAEAWTPLDHLDRSPVTKGMSDSFREGLQKIEDAKAAGEAAPAGVMASTDRHAPSALYEAMIRPLMPFHIKGAIWYQGESNAGRAKQYQTLFPAMITSWRDDWGQGDFPFFFVQLANFMARKPEPAQSNWAELREAQTMTLSLRKTGMACIIDIGEAGDIHPKNKLDVGRRLAMSARDMLYPQTELMSGNSPMMTRATMQSDQAIIRFQNAYGLKTTDGKAPRGFEIAGADGKAVWANARMEGSSIIVSHPSVPSPRVVRYGWADNPDVNVVNALGLPLVPFRSDSN